MSHEAKRITEFIEKIINKNIYPEIWDAQFDVYIIQHNNGHFGKNKNSKVIELDSPFGI